MGSLLALLSSALWGTADFFGGKLSKKYAPILVLGMTQAIGLLFGITLVLLSGELFGSNPPNAFGDGGYFFAGAIAGITGYIGLICLYAGLSTGRMGVVSPISALSAVIPLTVALVTGEVLTTAQGIGVVIAMVGAFCASGPELSQGLSPKPIFLALGAAAGFGTAMTFMAIGSESSALSFTSNGSWFNLSNCYSATGLCDIKRAVTSSSIRGNCLCSCRSCTYFCFLKCAV